MTGDNNEFLGVGRLDGLFLLSETPTSATVPIYEPEHTVVFPDKLHGGDSTLQIKTTVPEPPRSQLMFAYVWIGLNPWRKTGYMVFGPPIPAVKDGSSMRLKERFRK